MSNMYFNLVVDTEGIFTDEGNKVLIFSSSKDFVSEEIDTDRIERLSIDLVPEMGNIYSYDNETITDSQLLFELKNRGFEESKNLHLYEEEDEEEAEVKDESSVEEKEVTSDDESKDIEIEIEEGENGDEDEEGEEEVSSTTTSTAPTTPTVPNISIKDWNDLVGNYRLAYAFLVNYTTIGKKGIEEPIIIKGNGITGGELLDAMQADGVFTNDYRKNVIPKFYDESMAINSNKPGSIDGIGAYVLLAMGASEEVAKNIPTIYATDTTKFNNLMLYWDALLMATDVKYSKAIFKNALNSFDKEFKDTTKLFEFPKIDVPMDIENFVVNETVASTPLATTSSTGGSYTYNIVEVEGPIISGVKTLHPMILIHNAGAPECSMEILSYLKVRGLDVSTSPIFEFPKTCSDEADVDRLLAGIPNLSK